jgi:3-methyladenine DNA glycosylase AlkD
VPQVRETAKRFGGLSAVEIAKLLRHRVHEVRLAGLLAVVERFRRGDKRVKRETFELYLKLRRYVNNWDLVDLSAPKIVGAQLLAEGKGIGLLRKLASSANVWDRRIAVLSTFPFIDAGRHAEALEIARQLLRDRHDLTHKAVGWALREVGKRAGVRYLRAFLNRCVTTMPRTMLRYAIERLPERERQRYLRVR